MNLEHIAKKILWFFLLLCVFYTNNAYTEFLLFKVGDKASYTISQRLTSEYEIFDEITCSTSDATIDLDIEILSSNPDTPYYPFSVEVTIKKILISEIQQDGISSTTLSYDSSNTNKKNKILATHLNQLINHPLVFKVEKDFQIKEITDYLTEIYENFDSPSPMGLFGATPWTFELILTQLFHLAGEDLLPTNLYSTSCYQFLNWEDEALDEQEINLDQNSAYTVHSINSKKIKGSWKGKAKVESIEDDMNGEVSVMGTVKWDIANPLIQKRKLDVKIEAMYNGWFPGYVKISAQQTWKPTS